MKLRIKSLINMIFGLFPYPFCVLLLKTFSYNKISWKSRIGLSLLFSPAITLMENSRIGNFNIIICEEIILHKNARIKSKNIIKGYFKIVLSELSIINKNNKISGPFPPIIKPLILKFQLGYNTIIGVNHLVDVSSNIFIGSNSIFAGVATQLWTHGYYHFEDNKRVRVEGEIHIGENNYIGSRCIIMPGIKTANNISIGANCVVSKSLEIPGAYVSQGLRYLGKIEKEKLNNFEKIEYDGMVEPIFKKKLD